jgi:hypothetical protein
LLSKKPKKAKFSFDKDELTFDPALTIAKKTWMRVK